MGNEVYVVNGSDPAEFPEGYKFVVVFDEYRQFMTGPEADALINKLSRLYPSVAYSKVKVEL